VNDATNDAFRAIAGELRRYVGRRVADPHAAEDIVQDVFVRLVRRLDQPAGRGPGGEPPAGEQLHAFAFRAARNAVIDHYRRREPGAELPAELVAAPDPDAERAALAPLCASFRAFVHGLPPHQREALLLTEYEGLTQKELADRLGIAVSTVKSRVQRGRARLQQALLACCSFEFDGRGRVVDWQRRGDGCPDCG
jgi:RNA polymerase sigma-70 factor (ECF subfamily)